MPTKRGNCFWKKLELFDRGHFTCRCNEILHFVYIASTWLVGQGWMKKWLVCVSVIYIWSGCSLTITIKTSVAVHIFSLLWVFDKEHHSQSNETHAKVRRWLLVDPWIPAKTPLRDRCARGVYPCHGTSGQALKFSRQEIEISSEDIGVPASSTMFWWHQTSLPSKYLKQKIQNF